MKVKVAGADTTEAYCAVPSLVATIVNVPDTVADKVVPEIVPVPVPPTIA